jgi:alkylhydroperoxidase family enzyme
VTEAAHNGIPDAVYKVASRHFSDTELVNLTLAIVAINGWNRLAVSFRTVPGTYQPAHGRRHSLAASD